MPTKKCPKCSETIQESANKCKHCHTDLRSWFVRHKMLTGVMSIILFLIVVTAFAPPYESVETSELIDGKSNTSTAAVCAKNYVKASLKSPRSSKFPFALGATPLGDEEYLVSSHVDSENGFGSMIRTNFVCTVTVTDVSSFACNTECSFE